MKTDVSVVFEQIARGFMPARILMAGVELGAFEALARGARSSEEVAGELKADQRGTEILLGALADWVYWTVPKGDTRSSPVWRIGFFPAARTARFTF